MSVLFRPIKTEEIATLKEVIRSILETDFPEYSTKVKDYLMKVEFDIEEKIKIPIFSFWAAFQESKIIGFLVGFGPYGGVANIYWVGIVKEYQGQGVGRSFICHFENWAKENGGYVVHLFTSDKNLNFYEKLGYIDVGKMKSYWGTTDHIIYKAIDEPSEDKFIR